MSEPIRRCTVADVAREAKVSKAQAARALGGYGAVSEEVASRVQTAARRLGYRPNELARSMSTGRSRSLGVVVGDIENPHFGLATRGISDAARQAGYHVILANTDENPETERNAVRVLMDKRVDGLIVAPCRSNDNAHLQEVINAGRALVLFDRMVAGLEVEVISARFERAAERATQRLIAQGHHRIAYLTSLRLERPYERLTDLGSSPVAQRVAGMQRALAQAGQVLDPGLVRANATNREAIARICDELFSRPSPPTALMASDNLIALDLLRELKRRGLEIPRDISLVMYDDFPWTELVTPALTVIAQPVYAMGHEAANRLIRQLHGEASEPIPNFDAELIERGSIGPVTCATPRQGR
ncbi:LacI family DNA-binding transcriptional regulator [Halotalea alkalilenta]|uniref:LacI family DNA-binding transcriptional regulator n=1 Tax=Halotalea alkalilenta TaxID=376489 RepID=UPI00048A3C67|nr:LacI family DNA-binding transcriptional regulator [Halotalea alkalilenta]